DSEGPQAVEDGGDLLAAHRGVVAVVAASQVGDAVLAEPLLQQVQGLPQGPLAVGDPVLDQGAQRQARPDDLGGVHQLGEVAQVDVGLAEGEHVHVAPFDPDASAGRGVHRGGVDDAAGRGGQVGVAARPGQGAGLPGDVAGAVGVQHDHVVGDVEVVAAGAHDQHGGDAVDAVQRPDEVDEGDEGLAVAVHQPLHALVADHQVGGGGVLVHQQHGGPGLQGLGDVGGLGGGAGGVVGGEVGGVGSGGQVAHE